MPHVLYSNTYFTAPAFLWQDFKPQLHYRNAQFEAYFNGWAIDYYQKSWAEAGRLTKEKFEMFGRYLFCPAEWLLLPMVPFVLRDRRMRLLLATLLAGMLAVFVVVWGHPHYAAPLVAVAFALIVQAMRHLNTIRVKGRPIGALMVRVVIVTLFALTLDRALGRYCDVNKERCWQNFKRIEIGDELRNTAGKHLIMVRYNKDHVFHDEWVYNGAEIDSAKILWARELDEAQNERLFAYFKDRQVWLLRPDEVDPILRQLRPYPRVAAPSK